MTGAGDDVPGLCAEHGGLMWSDGMRACITPDDVIRGGCRWEPLDPTAIGMEEVTDRVEIAIHADSGGRLWREVER